MSKRNENSFDESAKAKRSRNAEITSQEVMPVPSSEFEDDWFSPGSELEEYPQDMNQEFEGVLPTESQMGGSQTGKGEAENAHVNKGKPVIEIITLSKSVTSLKLFNTKEYKQAVEIKFDFTDYDRGEGKTIQAIASDVDHLFKRLVRSVIEEGFKAESNQNNTRFTEEDLYSVAIMNKVSGENTKHKPIFIKPKKIKLFNDCPNEFSEAISRVIQSNDEFIFRAIDIVVYLTKVPMGEGRNRISSNKRAPIDQKMDSKRKTSVITIKNEDKSCGYRAVFIGSEWISEKYGEIQDFRSTPQYLQWRKIIGNGYSDNHQKYGTIAFINRANHFLHEWFHENNRMTQCIQPCQLAKRFNYNIPFGSDPDDYEHMNLYLCDLNQSLVVINANDTFNPLYLGMPTEVNDPKIHIEWLNDGHFNYIPDIKKYGDTKYFCHACYKGHWSTNHKCEYVCQACGKYPVCKEGIPVDCEACEITFVNHTCYSNHLQNTDDNTGPRCFNRKKCVDCKCFYKEQKGKKHVCGEYKCLSCGEKYTETPHYCMLKPLEISKLTEEDSKNKIIVTFDIESMVKIDETGNDLHIPNLLVSETVCDKCWDSGNKGKTINCDVCGEGLRVFDTQDNRDCVIKFTDYLYNDLARIAEAKKSRIIVFAHNSKGYDGHFIMQDIFANRNFKDQPQIILQGLKVLKLGINNVDFIDSLSFFQQPLSSLPKSFGFDSVVEKGFFPHRFNRPGNWCYSGQIPSIEEFGLKFMSDKAARECKIWHLEYLNSGKQWAFSEELVKYCKNDVKILTMAVMEFRKLFEKVTGLDPITRNFTLASVAMEHFRSSVLQENQIGITPIQGYIPLRNQSMKANIWLDFHQNQINDEIIREFKIGPYYVDGIHKQSNTIYEFFGCFFHGCDICNANVQYDEHPMYKPKTYNRVLKDTKEKIDYFEQKGYELVQIWEHEYDELVESDEGLKNYYSHRYPYYARIKKYGNINIRDAFFGGRTNNLYFTYECDEAEIIKYLDVTSLYPSVLVKNAHPIGHPKIITEFNSIDISRFFGFVKCKVSPPKDLNIPVLPFRESHKKLLFPLCGLCATNKINKCEHTEEERQIVGTWFSEELKLALTKGYIITNIYQVLHYEQKSEDLFKPYIQAWLKLKTQASGWPSSCDTEEKKQEFIQEFENREGVELECNEMQKNPGLRFISKLMLNSFWGKLGQRRNQGQTTICTNYSQFYNLISDAKNDIKGMLRINEETFLVSHCFIEDKYDRAGNTNIAVAAMVTGYARIKLYSIIDLIERSHPGRTLYFDTDSVIYVDRPGSGWENPEIGDFLGDMTDEVEKDYGPHAYIDKFTSGGPKNYAYSVKIGNEHKFVTKIKGMNISHGIKDVLNFNCVQEHAEKYREGDFDAHTIVDQLQFRATNLHQVHTRIFPKKYRAVSDKRVVLREGNRHTIPFGYQNN